MRKEIDKAVETFHSMAFGTSKGCHVISDQKLSYFVNVLTKLLIVRFTNNWYPDKPVRGSGYRCLRINSQSIDPCILKSMLKSEIPLKEIRTKELTIWVDPGVVSIRIGEEGSIGTESVEEEEGYTPPPLVFRSQSTEDEAYSSSDSTSPIPNVPAVVAQQIVNNTVRIPSTAQRGTIPRLITNTPMPHPIVSNAQDFVATSANIPPTMTPYHYTRARTVIPDMDSRSVAVPSYFKAYNDMAVFQSRQAAVAMSAHQMPRMVPRGNYLDITAQA